jgi:hypothetical protein
MGKQRDGNRVDRWTIIVLPFYSGLDIHCSWETSKPRATQKKVKPSGFLIFILPSHEISGWRMD